ncbi:MAG: hypothetical protein LBS57_04065 [Treponema sp.]|jgi:tetratricopeptide (TPR) repeat protein|nr:hypothetical protein [Treponema sp.]
MTKLTKRYGVLFLAIMLFTPARGLLSLDLLFRARPFAFFPLGSGGDPYETGYGGDLLFDVDLSSVFGSPFGLGYAAGLEGGVNIAPLKGGTGDNLSISSAGLGLNLFYYPLSRLSVRGEFAYGLYKSSYKTAGTSSTWWRAGAEAGFRFTPSFTLSAAGGFKTYANKYGGDMHSGLYAGLVFQLTIETSAASSVDAEIKQDENIFPLFLALYQQNPAADIRITNNESAEIRNVRVSFRAEDYTSSEFPCGTVPYMAKRKSAGLPLLADFSPQALYLTGDSRIVGELIIRYEILGKERTVTRGAALSVYGRNSFRWADASALAAFVSPTAPETLEFTKQLTGLARPRLRTGLNRNMQFGIYLFEGLAAAGIGYSPAVSTPYAAYRQSADRLDTIQFPFQTLAYRTGDLDDLGILYAAALEAAGIRAAFIGLEDDFLTAFSLGISQKAALSLFNGTDNILIVDDEVWIPVSMAAQSRGFTAAWKEGIGKLKEVFAAGGTADFVVIEEAWTAYPPADLPPQNLPPAQPEEAAAVKAAETALGQYIASEIEGRIQALNAQIRSGGPAADLLNQLGLLYIRAGRNADGLTSFERAAEMNSIAAMINAGNLSLIEKNYSAAVGWFNRVLSIAPDNAAAKRGLERSHER